jgi:hypothetical protein
VATAAEILENARHRRGEARLILDRRQRDCRILAELGAARVQIRLVAPNRRQRLGFAAALESSGRSDGILAAASTMVLSEVYSPARLKGASP